MERSFKIVVCLVLFLSSHLSWSQLDQAYQLYTSKGKKVKFAQVSNDILSSEFVFFGEYHDNPISHWMESEVMKLMHKKHGDQLVLGFEMFERDQQILLTEYIDGLIDDKRFEDSCRLWPNYKTDYKPLIMWAKQHHLNCVAGNIPRKYASQLFKRGRQSLGSLSPAEKNLMAPIDFKIDTTLSQYAALKEMEQHMEGKHMLEAQAIKDATMAQSILRYNSNGQTSLHFNGAYHSDFHQGIVWYLKKERPSAKVFTLTTVSQLNIDQLEKEHLGRADLIICVNENMTKTH